MLEEVKERVLRANRALVESGLVAETFGNASACDRAGGWVVIKPSGVAYERMTPEDMVVVALATGKPAEGRLNPSSDTPTHLVLFRAFPNVGGIVHTHSLHATAWAQARREIPPLGTTHADYFAGAVPLTRDLSPEEIQTDYEANTGRVIVERFADLDPTTIPAVLVAGHGPFAWAADVEQAVHNAIVLEHVARLASETLRVQPRARPISPELLNKHYRRKHGPDSYYGQDGRRR